MAENDNTIPDTGNNLFPIFVKLEELKLLIVGGGKIGLEKLQTVLQNSPSTAITLVAPEIDPAIHALAARNANIRLFTRPYHRGRPRMPKTSPSWPSMTGPSARP